MPFETACGRTARSGTRRVQFHVDDQVLLTLLIDILPILKGEQKYGKAPTTAVERVLMNYLSGSHTDKEAEAAVKEAEAVDLIQGGGTVSQAPIPRANRVRATVEAMRQ